jgi:hypothetical protein
MTWVWGANWGCFQARLAEPVPGAHSRDHCGRDWALAGASEVATGRQSWKDNRGLGDVVTKHDAGGDRDVEVGIGGVLQAAGGGTHG